SSHSIHGMPRCCRLPRHTHYLQKIRQTVFARVAKRSEEYEVGSNSGMAYTAEAAVRTRVGRTMTRRYYFLLLVCAIAVIARFTISDRWPGVHLAHLVIILVVMVTAAVCGALDERDARQ